MSEYESLRNDLDGIHSSMLNYASAVDRYAALVNEQFASVWADNAALRDELHAVANRLEALTHAVMADPRDVAEAVHGAVVTTCMVRGCQVPGQHYHDVTGAVVNV